MTNKELIQDMKDHIARGEYEGYALTNEECKQVIQALEQTWIPVSERLPEEMGTYMTTIDYGKCGLATGQRYYFGQGVWEDDCVIAWMPLPQPYKECDKNEANRQNN